MYFSHKVNFTRSLTIFQWRRGWWTSFLLLLENFTFDIIYNDPTHHLKVFSKLFSKLFHKTQDNPPANQTNHHTNQISHISNQVLTSKFNTLS